MTIGKSNPGLMSLSRRHALKAGGGAALAGLFAGCEVKPPAPAARVSPETLLEGLGAALDGDGLLTGEAIGKRYLARDQERKPLAVLRPSTTEQVSAILKLCHDAGHAVVPQGGMTGFGGGNVADQGEVVVSLERLDDVEDFDPVGGTLVAGAGAVLKSVHDFADAGGFLFGVDISSRRQATIGGMVSTNAGGERVVRYGTMRHNVLGLEAVLADGTIVSGLRHMVKDNAGYDVKQLFIGAEGTLAVVTRAVLRLQPKPDGIHTVYAGIDGFDNVPAFLTELKSELGGMLASFEVLWADYDAFAREYAPQLKQPLKAGHDFYVIAEALGSEPTSDVARVEAVLEAARAHGLVSDAVLARSDEERRDIWALREQAAAAFGKLGPFIGYDVSMPIRDMDGYAREVRERLPAAIPDCRSLIMGHMGDGNLHVIVAPGSREKEVHALVNDIVFAAVKSRNGSITGEHGIGRNKRDYLTLVRSDSEMDLMRGLKGLLDPKGILNPGKVL